MSHRRQLETIRRRRLIGRPAAGSSGPVPASLVGDGTNCLEVPDSALFAPGSGITVGCWIKTKSTGRSTEGFLSQSSNGEKSWSFQSLSNITTRIYCYAGDDGINTEALNPLVSGWAVDDWAHIVFQLNESTGVARAKVNNGSWVNSTVAWTRYPLHNSTAPLRIGADNSGANPLFSTSKLAFPFFSASVLSDADITTIYNARTLASMPSSVTEAWDFSDFDGSTTTGKNGSVATATAAGLTADTGDVP